MKLQYKKFAIGACIILSATSCSSNKEIQVEKTKSTIKYESYVVGGTHTQSRVLEGNILANNSVIKTATIAGKITQLNCEVGSDVNGKTLIAKITPDFTDPNIKGLITTKNSLDLQLGNIKGIKLSTVNNSNIQISTLRSTINSSEEQLKLSNKNYKLLLKQKGLTRSDLNSQLSTLEKQLENALKQKKITSSDLSSQLSTLEEKLQNIIKKKEITKIDLNKQVGIQEQQEENLEKQREQLLKSKKEELEKLRNSQSTLKVSSYNSISDMLLYIDELYSITKENKKKNEKIKDYLSGKNIVLKNKVKDNFITLNAIDYKALNNEELISFLGKLNNLTIDAGKGVKESIDNIYLNKQQIDGYYKILLGESSGLLRLKGNIEALLQSNNTIINTYDNKITGLDTSIDNLKGNISNLKNNKIDSILTGIDANIISLEGSIENLKNNKTESALTGIDTNIINLKGSIENLKNNKTDSTITGFDVNITNLESQITSLKNTITTQKNNIKSLEQNKKIAIKNLDNQILNITQNIKKININLSTQDIYAGVSGKVNKSFTNTNTNTRANSPLCQILEKGKGKIKIQIASAKKLSDGYIYSVEQDNNKIFSGSILSQVPTKDTKTQNYIYEKILKKDHGLTVGDRVRVHIEYPKKKKNKNLKQRKGIILVPIEYIVPKLNGYFVQLQNQSGSLIEKSVLIGEVNLPNIEIIKGVKQGDILIK